MIKYLGSKRRLVPVLGELLEKTGGTTALDLFTGTTRVARAFKQQGAEVTAVDTARYSEVFGRCYLEIDADSIDAAAVGDAIHHLNSLPGSAGYFTETFSRSARFFQPHNAERIDAIRDEIERDFSDSWMYPILLTSLILAADKVDSTTGVQMAYVKKWAPRSYKAMELQVPELIGGTGKAIRGDALQIASELGSFDLAYLDPPYNQHRYFTNYHIWETLVAWDDPEHYGVACKRIDSRDESTKSVFNKKQEMPNALGRVVKDVDAGIIVLSYNDESWIELDGLIEIMRPRGDVRVLGFDSKRYVGAQIGIHNPRGDRVGEVSHLRNLEYVVIAGEAGLVDGAVEGLSDYLVTAP